MPMLLSISTGTMAAKNKACAACPSVLLYLSSLYPARQRRRSYILRGVHCLRNLHLLLNSGPCHSAASSYRSVSFPAFLGRSAASFRRHVDFLRPFVSRRLSRSSSYSHDQHCSATHSLRSIRLHVFETSSRSTFHRHGRIVFLYGDKSTTRE